MTAGSARAITVIQIDPIIGELWLNVTGPSGILGVTGGIKMVIVTVEDSGRIELPAELRERLGIHPGSQVALEEAEGSVYLHVLSDQVQLVEKDGVWVVRRSGGSAEGNAEDWVARSREERLDSLVDV
jgi:AbrB family looped-hinge helix DNA binding protein